MFIIVVVSFYIFDEYMLYIVYWLICIFFYVFDKCEYFLLLFVGNLKWIYDVYIDFYIKFVIK